MVKLTPGQIQFILGELRDYIYGSLKLLLMVIAASVPITIIVFGARFITSFGKEHTAEAAVYLLILLAAIWLILPCIMIIESVICFNRRNKGL